MQEIVDRLRGEGHEGVWVVSLNQWESAPFLGEYAANVDGPVFQDGEGNPVQRLLDATTYSLWLVDRRARVRHRHPSSNLPVDRVLYTDQLRALATER